MKKIKFSEDYEKLPLFWNNSDATLIAVYPAKIKELKMKYPEFIKRDTKVRNERRSYPLNFEDALVLVFLHIKTGLLINTIRRSYPQKLEYYTNAIGEDFKLIDTRVSWSYSKGIDIYE